MTPKRRRPGSPKGQPKPAKRQLDDQFALRFKAALAHMPGMDVPALAAAVGCTRAVLHKYLGGTSKTIEALLLFEIADKLDVSPDWLLRNRGQMGRPASLSPDQGRALNTFDRLATLSPELGDFWVSQGEELCRRQPSLIATPADPFRGATVPKKVLSERER